MNALGLSITQLSVILGACAAMIFFVCTLARRRAFDTFDTGLIIGAFFSGSNFPAALFLMVYGFAPDANFALTQLGGQEKYVSAAGLALLATSAVGFWKTLTTRRKKARKKTSDLASLVR